MNVELGEACAAMPLFPLNGVLLMPGETLALHIFEPRYREMLADALARDAILSMATLVGDASGAHPELHPLISVGRVVRHHPLPQGRSHILLEYVGTAVIDEELTVETAYRQAGVTLCPPVPGFSYGDTLALKMLALQVRSTMGGDGPPESVFAATGAELVDALAAVFLTSAASRLAYLGAPSGETRRELVEEALVDLLGQLRASDA
ncbi:MAG: LON peptidase substrate-binding domain-containing protein [Myxococcota bacterium]